MNAETKSCLIVGAGDGLGGAIARAFAAEGLIVCMTRRERHLEKLQALAADIQNSGDQNSSSKAHAFGVDARDEEAMTALFDQIERSIAPLDVVVFNIGANVWFPITQTTARVYRKVWEMAAFAGFLTGREAARVMEPRGAGTILFTGATASLRGAAHFAAFAGAKHALRALAQSMARELSPKGVHVAHIIADGVIDGAFARENIPDIDQKVAKDAILSPDDIAANYVWLWKQKRTAWTHELDLRPWSEKW